MTTNIAAALLPVDSIQVSVLVDNVSDTLSTVPKDVKNEMAILLEKDSLPMAAGEFRCCAHHGLSLVIAATIGRDKQTLIFDAGPEAYAVTRNGGLLKTPFGDAGAVVLSHGHWDHAGGLTEAVRLASRMSGGRRVECHVNPEMFNTRATTRHGGYLLQKPIPTPEELTAAGGTVVNRPEARLLLDRMFYLSGEIPRITSYERGMPSQVRRLDDGSWVPDTLLMDERYIAVHLKDKGVLVFTACSHAGVVNVLKHARSVFGEVPLFGVMGGFHLSGAEVEPVIPETINDMRAFGLQRIVPGHCTGWRAVHQLLNTFGPATIVPSAVGRQFLF